MGHDRSRPSSAHWEQLQTERGDNAKPELFVLAIAKERLSAAPQLGGKLGASRQFEGKITRGPRSLRRPRKRCREHLLRGKTIREIKWVKGQSRGSRSSPNRRENLEQASFSAFNYIEANKETLR
jgi:hypothetical protein